jgi:integrator complex subunit 1
MPSVLPSFHHVFLAFSSLFFQHDASIEVQHPHLIDAVLQLAVYKPPLQVTTTTFAVSAWYWQACVVTVLLSCLNSNYGKRLWEEIPTGKMLLEMLITRSWSYPPFDYSGDHGTTREKIQHNEHVLRDKEKKEVLQFETALLQTKYPNLAATIDEQNSSLIHQVCFFSSRASCSLVLCATIILILSSLLQLILFDLKGPPRPPPLAVQKLLESLDSEFRIGRSLCCCRDPDFLVDIMSRQGPAEAMGWLSNIVENEPDTLEILPLPCVCEIVSSFILKETTFEFKQLPRALSRLLDTIQKASASRNGQDIHQILSFFFQRLIAK